MRGLGKCHLGQQRLRRSLERRRCHAESGRGQLHRGRSRRRLQFSERAIPGNSADGVRIDDAPDNQIGGPVASDGNVISSNHGAGVYITGADAAGNSIENNIIGLTLPVAGTAVARQRRGRRGQLLARHADRPGQRHFRQPDRHLDLRRCGDRCDRPRQPDRHRFDRARPTWATPSAEFRSTTPPAIRSKETTWVCR